jgi:hypothetical protein
MVEGNPGSERSGQTLIFTSGEHRFGSAAVIGIMIVIGIAAFFTDSSNMSSTSARGGFVFALLILTYIGFLISSRQWTAEIDIAARRLRISRRSFGRWAKTIVDCPLDECNVFGTIQYNTEGHISYGVYVQLKHGARHAIPLKDSTFEEAARVASQLSAATGIPRLDTIF